MHAGCRVRFSATAVPLQAGIVGSCGTFCPFALFWNPPALPSFLLPRRHSCQPCLIRACPASILLLNSQLLDYGVPEANIMGIRYGFKGFYDRKHKPVTLTRR